MKKILIAYYSRRGQNYSAGNIVDLKRGNTEIVAEKIQTLVSGDSFQIETIQKYPESYTATVEIARRELREHARPKLVSIPKSIDDYDTVILGYPNWCGTMPMAVCTFLESFDFSGKRIIPFCTNEGSGMGRSERDIAILCPKAKIIPGVAIIGNRAMESDEILKSFLTDNL